MMKTFSLADIEQSLQPYRMARRLIWTLLLENLITGGQLRNPFLLLSRLFIRLKSADSILEKINRNNLSVSSVSEISQIMDDLLGFRIITEDLEELWSVDRFLTANFQVKSRLEKIDPPGQFGYRSVEYSLIHHAGGLEIPFEVQLRTLLQHYWTSRSFSLFHKAPPAKALEHEKTLISLSEVLAEAEQLASLLGTNKETSIQPGEVHLDLDRLPVYSQVNLIVVEPGECFAKQVKVGMSGNDLVDNQSIVDQKVALYASYPNAAIVECMCMSFLTFVLNEPHVKIPLKKLDQIMW